MTDISNLIPVTPLVDENRKCQLDWRQFFQAVVQGDPGNKFSPDIENLTYNGNPTITGVYYQNQGFVDFYVRIQPGTDTTSTAGTTYIHLPFTVRSDCPCFATTNGASSLGGIIASNNRAYLPAWSALTSPVTISARIPVQ